MAFHHINRILTKTGSILCRQPQLQWICEYNCRDMSRRHWFSAHFPVHQFCIVCPSSTMFPEATISVNMWGCVPHLYKWVAEHVHKGAQDKGHFSFLPVISKLNLQGQESPLRLLSQRQSSTMCLAFLYQFTINRIPHLLASKPFWSRLLFTWVLRWLRAVSCWQLNWDSYSDSNLISKPAQYFSSVNIGYS